MYMYLLQCALYMCNMDETVHCRVLGDHERLPFCVSLQSTDGQWKVGGRSDSDSLVFKVCVVTGHGAMICVCLIV